MTFNIRCDGNEPGSNSWSNRRSLVVDIINDNHPDIVGLQEVEFNQLQHLKSSLSDYACIGIGRDISESQFQSVSFNGAACDNFDGNDDGEYAPIFFLEDKFELLEWGAFWFSPTPNKPSKFPNASHNRICTWAKFEEIETGNEFYAFNLHLEQGQQLERHWIRQQSVMLLIEKIRSRRSNDPVAVTGDFNAVDNDMFVIPWMTGEETELPGQGILTNNTPLFDTWRTRYPSHPREGTRHDWDGSQTKRRIDYIFVSELTTVDDSEIIHVSQNGVHPSDHFPVVSLVYLPL